MNTGTVGVLIVASIAAIWFLVIVAWIVAIIRDPSFDYLRPELKYAPPSHPVAPEGRDVDAGKLARQCDVPQFKFRYWIIS